MTQGAKEAVIPKGFSSADDFVRFGTDTESMGSESLILASQPYSHLGDVMQDYPVIKNLLCSIFSVDVGLDESEAFAALGRVLNDKRQREKIEHELLGLFNDQSALWVELLDNDSYVVYPADDKSDAKSYLVGMLWNKVFPGVPAP